MPTTKRTKEGQALLNLAAADADWYRLIYHRVPLIEAEARAEGYAAGLKASPQGVHLEMEAHRRNREVIAAHKEGYAAGLAAARGLVAVIPCLMHVPPGRCLDVDMAPPSWSPCANCQAIAAFDALAVDPRSE